MDSAALANLLPLILIAILIWFVMIRPVRNRQRQAANTQSSLRPGQRVITTAGLHARVESVEDDAVMLEVAPGVVCRYLKPAVTRIIDDPDAGVGESAHTDQDQG